MTQTIYFRVDGDDGKSHGLGHIYRSIKIYRLIKKNFKNKFRYVFLSKNLREGINVLKKNLISKIIYYEKKNFKNYNFAKNDIFIIDTLGKDSSFIKKLNSLNIENKISFDELNIGNFKSGIIINGILFAKKKLKKRNNVSIYQGEKYIILNENYKKKIFRSRNQNKLNVIISSGGADHKNFLYRISKILLKLNYFEKISVIIGAAVKKNNLIFKLNSKKINLKYGYKDLCRLIQKNDFFICTGGTVMFEAIAVGKKPLVYENYSHQKYAINYFKNKKSIQYMGPSNKMNINHFKKIFNKIKDHDHSQEFKKNVKLIDGFGLDRTNKIIKNFINECLENYEKNSSYN